MATVFLLVLPYFLISNPYASLAFTLVTALMAISVFTFYTSVAQDLPFKTRFIEMAAISLGVSALTFTIGYIVKITLGVGV